MRSRVQTITPAKAAQLLETNESNRSLSRQTVRGYAEAMQRGEWQVSHQSIAVDTNGVLIDGQHRLAAVIEAGQPVDMLVTTGAPPESFAVMDTGRRRNAADALSIEGEANAVRLAAILRIVWLYDNNPHADWSSGRAAPTTTQVMETLEHNPAIRDFLSRGDQIGEAIGMTQTAAAAASYLVWRAATRPGKLDAWWDGIIDGAGLSKTDPRLRFRNVMLYKARRQPAGQRRRDTREQVALYLEAFNAWASGQPAPRLRYTPRTKLPAIVAVK